MKKPISYQLNKNFLTYSKLREKGDADTLLRPMVVAIFIILHIILAYEMMQYTFIATLHALATFGLGLLWLSDRTPRRVIYVIAYITGAELLWRVTNAGIFYEFGKYSLSLLLILAILKFKRLRAASKVPLLFFLLLLPSILELPYFSRSDISFNLSGPLSLAISSMFFSTVTITTNQLKRILLGIIAPISGLVFLATFSTITAEKIEFTGISSKATSAGFGPNQVATILGFGALCAIYFALIENRFKDLRLLLILLSTWMIAQAALTFSRGGIWAAAGALMVAVYFLFRGSRSKLSVLFPILFIIIIGYTMVWPILQSFTGGLISQRFADLETTGRIEILQSDLYTFRRHPYLGVGPGQSYFYHDIYFRASQAHTEYSRMLAEHGILGLGALLLLFGMASRRYLTKDPLKQKSFSGTFTTWSLLTMLHSAMRLAAPGFTFGFAGVKIVDEEESKLDQHIETSIPNKPDNFQ